MIPFALAALAASMLMGWLSAVLVTGVLNQPAQPSDLYSLQWAVIIALAGVIPVLYWQNVKLRDRHDAEMKEVTKAYHDALHINTLSNKEIARAIQDQADIGRLENQIRQLEQQLEKRLDKRQD